eukprot:TRINITY_DN477_c2_g1_i2.p1 TRINITY_DN477_c2_g1~~TRINITY_DN477_c2_g1_i2.p1  ORF type:complete len:2145 (+),score=515.29 TRINITY_DN477_c2_g1_i2:620-6436(+)
MQIRLLHENLQQLRREADDDRRWEHERELEAERDRQRSREMWEARDADFKRWQKQRVARQQTKEEYDERVVLDSRGQVPDPVSSPDSKCPGMNIPMIEHYSEFKSKVQIPHFAYATFVTSADFVIPAAVLMHSIALSGSKYDRVIAVTSAVSDHDIELLSVFAQVVRVLPVIAPKFVDNARYRDTFTKLRIWQLTQWKKLFYIDTDVLVLRNMDDVFDLNEWSVPMDAMQGRYSTGMMLVEPRLSTFQDMIVALATTQVSMELPDLLFLQEFFLERKSKINIIPRWYQVYQEEFGHAHKTYLTESQSQVTIFDPRIHGIHYPGADKPFNYIPRLQERWSHLLCDWADRKELSYEPHFLWLWGYTLMRRDLKALRQHDFFTHERGQQLIEIEEAPPKPTPEPTEPPIWSPSSSLFSTGSSDKPSDSDSGSSKKKASDFDWESLAGLSPPEIAEKIKNWGLIGSTDSKAATAAPSFKPNVCLIDTEDGVIDLTKLEPVSFEAITDEIGSSFESVWVFTWCTNFMMTPPGYSDCSKPASTSFYNANTKSCVGHFDHRTELSELPDITGAALTSRGQFENAAGDLVDAELRAQLSCSLSPGYHEVWVNSTSVSSYTLVDGDDSRKVFEVELLSPCFCPGVCMHNDTEVSNLDLPDFVAEKRIRSDGRCGSSFPIPGTLLPSECDPTTRKNEIGPCCSSSGFCGPSPDHCECRDCVDYSKVYKEALQRKAKREAVLKKLYARGELPDDEEDVFTRTIIIYNTTVEYFDNSTTDQMLLDAEAEDTTNSDRSDSSSSSSSNSEGELVNLASDNARKLHDITDEQPFPISRRLFDSHSKKISTSTTKNERSSQPKTEATTKKKSEDSSASDASSSGQSDSMSDGSSGMAVKKVPQKDSKKSSDSTSTKQNDGSHQDSSIDESSDGGSQKSLKKNEEDSTSDSNSDSHEVDPKAKKNPSKKDAMSSDEGSKEQEEEERQHKVQSKPKKKKTNKKIESDEDSGSDEEQLSVKSKKKKTLKKKKKIIEEDSSNDEESEEEEEEEEPLPKKSKKKSKSKLAKKSTKKRKKSHYSDEDSDLTEEEEQPQKKRKKRSKKYVDDDESSGEALDLIIIDEDESSSGSDSSSGDPQGSNYFARMATTTCAAGTHTIIESLVDCEAAVSLLTETKSRVHPTSPCNKLNPIGCYYNTKSSVYYWNPCGDPFSKSPDRVAVCQSTKDDEIFNCITDRKWASPQAASMMTTADRVALVVSELERYFLLADLPIHDLPLHDHASLAEMCYDPTYKTFNASFVEDSQTYPSFYPISQHLPESTRFVTPPPVTSEVLPSPDAHRRKSYKKRRATRKANAIIDAKEQAYLLENAAKDLSDEYYAKIEEKKLIEIEKLDVTQEGEVVHQILQNLEYINSEGYKSPAKENAVREETVKMENQVTISYLNDAVERAVSNNDYRTAAKIQTIIRRKRKDHLDFLKSELQSALVEPDYHKAGELQDEINLLKEYLKGTSEYNEKDIFATTESTEQYNVGDKVKLLEKITFKSGKTLKRNLKGKVVSVPGVTKGSPATIDVGGVVFDVRSGQIRVYKKAKQTEAPTPSPPTTAPETRSPTARYVTVKRTLRKPRPKATPVPSVVDYFGDQTPQPPPSKEATKTPAPSPKPMKKKTASKPDPCPGGTLVRCMDACDVSTDTLVKCVKSCVAGCAPPETCEFNGHQMIKKSLKVDGVESPITIFKPDNSTRTDISEHHAAIVADLIKKDLSEVKNIRLVDVNAGVGLVSAVATSLKATVQTFESRGNFIAASKCGLRGLAKPASTYFSSKTSSGTKCVSSSLQNQEDYSPELTSTCPKGSQRVNITTGDSVATKRIHILRTGATDTAADVLQGFSETLLSPGVDFFIAPVTDATLKQITTLLKNLGMGGQVEVTTVKGSKIKTVLWRRRATEQGRKVVKQQKKKSAQRMRK